MNANLHAIREADRLPVSVFLTTRQVHYYIAAVALLDDLPKAQ